MGKWWLLISRSKTERRVSQVGLGDATITNDPKSQCSTQQRFFSHLCNMLISGQLEYSALYHPHSETRLREDLSL